MIPVPWLCPTSQVHSSTFCFECVPISLWQKATSSKKVPLTSGRYSAEAPCSSRRMHYWGVVGTERGRVTWNSWRGVVWTDFPGGWCTAVLTEEEKGRQWREGTRLAGQRAVEFPPLSGEVEGGSRCTIWTILRKGLWSQAQGEKEWNLDICYNTEEPWKRYAKWKESLTRRLCIRRFNSCGMSIIGKSTVIE